jgi:hypothetical protein
MFEFSFSLCNLSVVSVSVVNNTLSKNSPQERDAAYTGTKEGKDVHLNIASEKAELFAQTRRTLRLGDGLGSAH